MTILKLQTKFQSRLFSCKFPQQTSGEKLNKICNRCVYKGAECCPLQQQPQSNVLSLEQFRKQAPEVASTN